MCIRDRGATIPPTASSANRRQFQSTHPHGVRRDWPESRAKSRKISIHAPAWGATGDIFIFNFLVRFQSTHPHGVRQAMATDASGSAKNFNPRTRMGCDPLCDLIQTEINRFQSTHPHGVRLARSTTPPTKAKISIHAPAWGATRTQSKKSWKLIFQSTHPHGVRRK